jgi:hypothetical protein
VPRRDEVAKAIITVPSGFHLCSEADSYSSLLWFYVPLDKTVRCEDLPEDSNWAQMPDFIVIGPNPDTPMRYETTADVVKDEPFFCHGMSYDYPSRHSISNAHTVIAPAGKKLAGLDTIVCSREDAEKDKYAKAFLAYRPSSDGVGHAYIVAADVRLNNKTQADRLLQEIVKSFKLLN